MLPTAYLQQIQHLQIYASTLLELLDNRTSVSDTVSDTVLQKQCVSVLF